MDTCSSPFLTPLTKQKPAPHLEEPMVDILSPIDISVTFKHNDFAVDIFNSVYENLDSIPKIKEQTSNTKIEIANDCSGKVCHAKLVFNDVFIETHNNGGYRPIGIHDDIIVDTGSSQADTGGWGNLCLFSVF